MIKSKLSPSEGMPPRRPPAARKSKEMSHGNWKLVYADFVTVLMAFFLVVWIISKLKIPRKSTIVGISIVIGFIAFCNTSYTEHIWYPVFDLRAQLIDAVVAWGLCGLWLSRYFGQKI